MDHAPPIRHAAWIARCLGRGELAGELTETRHAGGTTVFRMSDRPDVCSSTDRCAGPAEWPGRTGGFLQYPEEAEMFRRKRQPQSHQHQHQHGHDHDHDHDHDHVDAPSPVATITDASFLDQTAGAVTLVDFWAPWCGPCKAFAPIFEAAAADYDGRVRFGKCDVDASPNTAALLQIQSLPTLVAFGPDGSELGRASGAMPRRQLDALIERLTAPASR